MRLVVQKHPVINGKIILCAIVFFFLYAMTVNKDVIPLSHRATPSESLSNIEVLQNTQILRSLRVQNEKKEQTLANRIDESKQSGK